MLPIKTPRFVEASVHIRTYVSEGIWEALVKTSAKITPLQLKDAGFCGRTPFVFPVPPTTKRRKEAVSQVSTYVALAHQTSPQHKTLKKPETEAPQKPQITSRKSLHFTTRNTKVVSKKSKTFSDLSSSRCLGEMQQGATFNSDSELNQL